HIVNPRNYLFQTAKTVILMQMRRLKELPLDAFETAETLDVAAPEPSPEQVVSDRQALKRTADLIAALPKKPREVFVLRKVHGLSQREIAKKTGLSESTVEKHIGKCVRLLMDSIKHGGNPEDRASNPVGVEKRPDNDDPRATRHH